MLAGRSLSPAITTRAIGTNTPRLSAVVRIFSALMAWLRRADGVQRSVPGSESQVNTNDSSKKDAAIAISPRRTRRRIGRLELRLSLFDNTVVQIFNATGDQIAIMGNDGRTCLSQSLIKYSTVQCVLCLTLLPSPSSSASVFMLPHSGILLSSHPWKKKLICQRG
jgi:hypothetical protein